MAQRNSEYKRRPLDAYFTPPWVVHALVLHLPRRLSKVIWEPAAGKGYIAKELRKCGYRVLVSDIKTGADFLAATTSGHATTIVTNPPYNKAEAFIVKALEITRARKGVVAMLLRIDWDSGITRRYLFADHPAWHKKVVLTKRIRWIEGSRGNPSENHAWYIWDWRNQRPPTIWYSP